jgi:resolvase-like protein
VAVEYVDAGVSGSKDRRPALDQLVADAKRRKFDVVVCWRLDRLGRSLKHLITLLDDLQALGVAFVHWPKELTPRRQRANCKCTSSAPLLNLNVVASWNASRPACNGREHKAHGSDVSRTRLPMPVSPVWRRCRYGTLLPRSVSAVPSSIDGA